MSKDKKARKRHIKMMRKSEKLIRTMQKAQEKLQRYTNERMTSEAQTINIDFDKIKKIKPFKMPPQGVMVESTNDEVRHNPSLMEWNHRFEGPTITQVDELTWPPNFYFELETEHAKGYLTVLCPNGTTKEQLTPVVEAIAAKLNKLRDGK